METKNDFVRNECIVDGIPVLEIYADDGRRKPLVIFSHGFTGKKEDMNRGGYMEEFASRGFFTVALDNRLHGKRPGPNFTALAIRPPGRVNVLEVRKAIMGTAEDICSLIVRYGADARVDADRVGVTGVSMGGFAAFKAVSMDHRIAVAAPFISSPFWDDIPGDVPTVENEEELRGLAAYSGEFSPGYQPDSFFPCALLMQAGDCDSHFKVEKLRGFYTALQERYGAAPGRVRLVVYPGVKHEVTARMQQEALDWLEKYLKSAVL